MLSRPQRCFQELPEDQAYLLATFCKEQGDKLKQERQEKDRQDAVAIIADAYEKARAICDRHGVEFKGGKPPASRQPKQSYAGFRFEDPATGKVWPEPGKKPARKPQWVDGPNVKKTPVEEWKGRRARRRRTTRLRSER